MGYNLLDNQKNRTSLRYNQRSVRILVRSAIGHGGTGFTIQIK